MVPESVQGSRTEEYKIELLTYSTRAVDGIRQCSRERNRDRESDEESSRRPTPVLVNQETQELHVGYGNTLGDPKCMLIYMISTVF